MENAAKAVEEKAEAQQDQESEASQANSKNQAQSAEFPEAVETTTSGPAGSIEILLDMDVPVTVTVGQTEITVRRLLQLGPGSVLKLDKPIDAPVDLYLRETKFATGDVVVVDDCFAVRIKQILGVGASGADDSADKAAET